MISKERRKQSWKDGGVSATRYDRACKDARKSSRDEDIHKHIDFWHGSDGVDVKGNNLPDEIWCEFQNVNGNPGWMYGHAKIIAFDMPEAGGFCIVNPKDLQRYCENNVEDVIVTEKSQAYRKKYQRNGRQDLITRLQLSDLKRIGSYRVWDYFKDYE